MYGFDVYTPYFKDTAVFKSLDSYNPLDRPHASFQYFGWSKKGISLHDKYRWELTVKAGKIGGFAGEGFQTPLHQDITQSPKPVGWGAQIANGGRIGVSFEGTYLWQIMSNKNAHGNWWIYGGHTIGTFKTGANAGLTFSNRPLAKLNPNFVIKRKYFATNPYTGCRIKNWMLTFFSNLVFQANFQSNFVQHNTMLQGYGIANTSEGKELTPKSKYTLSREQVRFVNYSGTLTFAYPTPFYTFFYKLSRFSPETKGLDDIGIKRYSYSTENMKIGHRFHHYGTFGMVFIMH